MNYQINDTILYGSQGVCKITGTVQKDFGGCVMDYYTLQPVYSDNSVIYVPMHNEALLRKMRRVLSQEEIYALIQAMPRQDVSWIEDENKRKEICRDILARGDRIELIRAIKALYLHQQELQQKGKKLHVSDERFLKEAEKMLYDEFALVLNIREDEVLPFIMKQIEVGEKQPV